MKIILSPQAALGTPCPAIVVNGLTITIDGTDYDLSLIPEGGQAESAEDSPFIGTVTRDQVTIRYPYDMEKAEDNQSTNWDDWTFDVVEGAVPCPIKWRTELDLAVEKLAKGMIEGLQLAGYNDKQIAAMTLEEHIAALEKEGYSMTQIEQWRKEVEA